MRSIKMINNDIDRCKKQIASTYTNEQTLNNDNSIIREGFQKQLQILNDELEQVERIRSITVVDPRIVPADETKFLGI